MKVVKYILGILFIFTSLGAVAKGSFLAFLFLMILGLVFLPPISDLIKEKFKLWQNKAIRYVSYIILFFVAGIFIPSDLSVPEKKIPKSNNKERKNANKENLELSDSDFNFKKCNYGGGDFYIIPNMTAGYVYTNFEERGFSVSKNIQSQGTDIQCTLQTPNVKYDVIITGCTPSKIISVEAMVIDYSGKNINDVTAFLAFVATLEYKNSNSEEARKWVQENINIDGAKTIIGGVTFRINFKSKFSKAFSMQIEESEQKKVVGEKKVYYDANGVRQ